MYYPTFTRLVLTLKNFELSRFIDMSTTPTILSPPKLVRGMTILDKSKFEKIINIPRLNFKCSNISSIVSLIKKYLLKLENFKPVQKGSENVVIYLNPHQVTDWHDIADEDRNHLEDLQVTQECFATTLFTLTYANYRADDIFKSILPVDQDGTASFTKVGHIVHVNLREHLLPYKKLIGQVLLDKVANAHTVVNKIDCIDSTYRNFQMEILSGQADMKTKVKENGCQFEFDFSTVYWNSRLCTEHERIISMLRPTNVVFDVFAGVGPFTVPAAKKKCTVFANDLNPESYKWLNYNLKLNKIDGRYINTYNKDGRNFILEDLKSCLLEYINRHDVYIIMNLPAAAVEFLNLFCGMYHPDELQEITNPPVVFVYCFAKGEDYTKIAKELVLKSFECDVSDKIVDVFKVRSVSTLKEMMRVSIKLDEDILLEQERNCPLHKRKSDEELSSKCEKRSWYS